MLWLSPAGAPAQDVPPGDSPRKPSVPTKETTAREDPAEPPFYIRHYKVKGAAKLKRVNEFFARA